MRPGFNLELQLRTVEADIELHEEVHLAQYERYVITLAPGKR